MGETRRNTVITAKRAGHLRPFESILDPLMSERQLTILQASWRTVLSDGSVAWLSRMDCRVWPMLGKIRNLPNTEESHQHTGMKTKEEPG